MVDPTNQEELERLAAELDAFDEELEPECPGHPSGPYDAMGMTVYCDGSCLTTTCGVGWPE